MKRNALLKSIAKSTGYDIDIVESVYCELISKIDATSCPNRQIDGLPDRGYSVSKLWDDVEYGEGGGSAEHYRLPETVPYTMVYIDSFTSGIQYGEFVNSYIDIPIPFAGLGDLVLKMDHLYDILDFPQTMPDPRSYNRMASYIKKFFDNVPEDRIRRKPEKIMTFLIRIQFHQNGSWQGSVSLASEGGKTKNYTSALQCMRLMDEAMQKLAPEIG